MISTNFLLNYILLQIEYKKIKISFYTDICVVWFIIINFSKDRYDCFRKFIYFYIPFFKDIYSRLWRATTHMEKNSSWSKSSMDVINRSSQLFGAQAVESGFFYYTVYFEIRPLFGNIDSLPLYSSFEIPLFTLFLID